MSKYGQMVQQVQEIVEESFFLSEEEIVQLINERFEDRPEFKPYLVELARFEIKTIKADMDSFQY